MQSAEKMAHLMYGIDLSDFSIHAEIKNAASCGIFYIYRYYFQDFS